MKSWYSLWMWAVRLLYKSTLWVRHVVYVGVWIINYLPYLIVLFWYCEGQAFSLHGHFRICLIYEVRTRSTGCGPWWCYFCMVMYLHGSHTWSMVLLKHLWVVTLLERNQFMHRWNSRGDIYGSHFKNMQLILKFDHYSEIKE